MMVMHPLIPVQVPLRMSVNTSSGYTPALSGCTGLSIRALRIQQGRANLVHLLSVKSLTYSPTLVEAIVDRLSSITWLRAANRSNIESLLLLVGSALSPNDIEDLLSISLYYDHYINFGHDHITKTMWLDLKNEHYELFTSRITLWYRTL